MIPTEVLSAVKGFSEKMDFENGKLKK